MRKSVGEECHVISVMAMEQTIEKATIRRFKTSRTVVITVVAFVHIVYHSYNPKFSIIRHLGVSVVCLASPAIVVQGDPILVC